MGVTSMEDAAALASSAQPTGYTLQTTSVHTKVRKAEPFCEDLSELHAQQKLHAGHLRCAGCLAGCSRLGQQVTVKSPLALL